MDSDQIKRYEDRNIFRGHLPPAFYNGQDDNPRRQYLSEPGLHEPNGMTKGGSGSAINRLTELSGELAPGAAAPHYDADYRHYGDRRWRDNAESAWETEYYSRRGYRSIDERVEIGKNTEAKAPLLSVDGSVHPRGSE